MQLFNAAKYASSFPALVLTALERDAHIAGVVFPYRRLWLLVMILNTAYSFYWDVEQDWDMPWLYAAATGQRHGSHHHRHSSSSGGSSDGSWPSKSSRTIRGLLLPGLKSDALYSPKAWYAWAVCSNLVLRFVWLYRLVGRLELNGEVALAFALCEVWRRCVVAC